MRSISVALRLNLAVGLFGPVNDRVPVKGEDVVAKQRTPGTDSVESAVRSTSSPASLAANSEDIAALAFQLWQARGCPYGSPDIDWFQAEEQLRNQARRSAQSKEPIVMRRAGA